jgi:hypothetical protein
MHPLADSLSSLTDEELQKKYGELQRRLIQSSRFGPFDLVPQLQMLLEDYQFELSERQRRQVESMEKRAEESGRGFKGIIDIQ